MCPYGLSPRNSKRGNGLNLMYNVQYPYYQGRTGPSIFREEFPMKMRKLRIWCALFFEIYRPVPWLRGSACYVLIIIIIMRHFYPAPTSLTFVCVHPERAAMDYYPNLRVRYPFTPGYCGARRIIRVTQRRTPKNQRREWGSNSRPFDPESRALTTRLSRQSILLIIMYSRNFRCKLSRKKWITALTNRSSCEAVRGFERRTLPATPRQLDCQGGSIGE